MSYLPHLITFVLCIYALALTAGNTLQLRGCSGRMVNLGMCMSILQAATLLAFLYNQSIWLIDNHEDSVGVVASISWLAYDYANTLFHIVAAASLRSYLSRYK